MFVRVSFLVFLGNMNASPHIAMLSHFLIDLGWESI